MKGFEENVLDIKNGDEEVLEIEVKVLVKAVKKDNYEVLVEID